jgi:tRNA dimethylallyltransferase
MKSLNLKKKRIKQLIVIEGPTASGKTALSIALAKHFSTVIFSADSRQFYKELAIGTAKPSKDEMQGIVHYFIDSHSIETELTAANYEQQALPLIEAEFVHHDTLILVGGSGMFIDALCYGLDPIPVSKEIREALNVELANHGLEPLVEELQQKDPLYYQQVDTKNPMRIIRALEVIRLSGKTYSSFRKSTSKQRPFRVHKFVIEHDRDKLYDRINQRVDTMLKQGLVEEVKAVYPKRHLNALRTVGYSELFAYLDSEISFSEAVEKIKKNTRNYAKRQLTWFKKQQDSIWVPFDTPEKMMRFMLDRLTKK